ncbi:hypothetical protein GCM10009775_36750 [Microbacterium aoyamense]|uniref:PD-(D/E)XK endonuclease-like domain-containing protein n=1 Tax=Microbacterium aoyamense TaxID=344166 RepID=A0ABN2Q1Q2_9MICO|nr:PD-(D/E)XK nuclease family protein [Microbacterium aoyamense]
MQTHMARYGADAVGQLRGLVGEAKANDPLAPVTILARDNIAAITIRRALAQGVGDRRGVAAVEVTTLRRLAEQVLAAGGDTRRPVTTALLTALWRRVLSSDPGCFAAVAEHPSTVRALVRAHRELRECDADALTRIASTSVLGADLVRLHEAVTVEASVGRRDEVAVLADATLRVQAGADLSAVGTIILYLPEEPTPSEYALIAALDEASGLRAVVGVTRNRAVDRDDVADVDAESLANAVVHASDSDDEVRAIVREVRALLARGVPAHRIAVLHPVAVPYARLVHDHLAQVGITTNGPGVRPLRDRAIADAFLTLLSLEPESLRRVAVFDWLGRAPIRLGEGNLPTPRTRWEKLSRRAGVTDGDWSERLADHVAREQARLDADRDNPDASAGGLAYRERSIAEAQELASFIVELRHRLEEGRSLTSWAALSEWALGLLHRYIGRTDARNRLPEEEQRAATAIEVALGAIAELDGLGNADVAGVREILEVDLDARKPRVGRFGDGVFVGPIGSAPSLDVDHVFVLGLSEDLYPGRRSSDPLLPDAVRELVGGALPTASDGIRRQHRAVLAAFSAAAHVTASFPRGDLRRGAERLPSRWLMPTIRSLSGIPALAATKWSEASGLRTVASHWEGVSRAERPATRQEWRLRHLAGRGTLDGDRAVDAAVELIDARRDEAFTRFDGNLNGVAGLPDYADGRALVSPTALEGYAGCAHAFFVERLLGARPLESPEEILSIRAWDLGSIVHEVIDRLTTESADRPDFGEPWTPEHRALMRTIADEVMDDYERRGLTGHPRLWEREREVILRDLELFLDLDDEAHARHGSRIVGSELAFGMKGKPAVHVDVDGGAIGMRGSADRVDQTRDGRLIVTDFKTGSAGGFKDIGTDPVAAGRKLQLPLYAHAAQAAFGEHPVDAGYWFIGRRDRGKRVEVTLDEHLEELYRGALGTLAAGIRDGLFLARPPANDDFLWVQCAYCNPDGVGYGHVRGASERKRTDVVLAKLYTLLDPSVVARDGGAL